MKQAIPDSAHQYMVSLAQVRAARKAKQAQTVKAAAAPVKAAAPGPAAFSGPSQLDETIFCLLCVREVLINMGHSEKSNTIKQIDRVLRRPHER